MEAMNIKATVQVDFHLSPDGEHTLALADDVTAAVVLQVGDVVVATDGESSHLAVVNSVNDDVLSLVVLSDAAVSATRRSCAGARGCRRSPCRATGAGCGISPAN